MLCGTYFVSAFELTEFYHTWGKKSTQKFEMCYTCFTLSQNVPEYVHSSRELVCIYKMQMISVYFQATKNILLLSEKSKGGILLYFPSFKAPYHYMNGVKCNFSN